MRLCSYVRVCREREEHEKQLCINENPRLELWASVWARTPGVLILGYHRDPNTKALKKKGFINHRFTLDTVYLVKL